MIGPRDRRLEPRGGGRPVPSAAMLLSDPFGIAVLIGLAAAPVGAACARGGRLAGTAGGVAFGVALALAERLGAPPAAIAVGALTCVAASLAVHGLPFGAIRRRSFGAAYPRGAFAGAMATSELPPLLGRPSRHLDAADRVRLESALAEIERKSGVQIAVVLVARATELEGARWRATLYGTAVGLAAAAAADASALSGLAAAAAGALGGRAMAMSTIVRRAFVSRAALAGSVAQAASDAFAHAGLAAAPGDRGLLLFASIFEARVAVLAGHGLAPGGASEALDAMARAITVGFASGNIALGFMEAARLTESLPAPETPSPRGRPHPVRVED
jgi:uncharacterized membrane protein